MYIRQKYMLMQISTLPLQQLHNNQIISDCNKPILQGFMTLEDFSKKLDDKISDYYEKLPDSHCSKSTE
jgi:hypothetical protein